MFTADVPTYSIDLGRDEGSRWDEVISREQMAARGASDLHVTVGTPPAIRLRGHLERIVISDKRVMLAQGFIVARVGMMPLSKVTDLTFQRSLRGRLLGYGTLIVESAGQIQALSRIDYIPRPEEVYEALSELVFGEKGRTRATGMLAKGRSRR